MNTTPPKREDEAGFTIIEVMVAIFVLLLGLLGAVTMIDTANGLTNNNKSREGGLNLSREIAEAARLTDYDSLTAGGATAALQGNSGLADADGSTAGWQLIRRGIKFTVTVSACTYDDPKDGGRSTTDAGSYCAGSAAQVVPATGNCAAKPVTPCVDTNPDDFRKLAITSSWTLNGNTRSSTQTAFIVNPSGGRGPRISNITVAPTLVGNTFGPSTPGTTVSFTVTSSSLASAVEWSSSDGVSKGSATAGASNTWTFSYDLGSVGASGSVLDGTYTISMQAFSAAGVPGDLATYTLVVNRSAPSDVRNFAGGRNDRNGDIVDFTWIRNSETDIVGYRVYWVRGLPDWNNPSDIPGNPDQIVCGSPTPLNGTACFDPSPSSGAQTYYIKAVDRDTNGNLRESAGAASAQLTTATTASAAPTWPGGTVLSGATTSGIPSLSWNNAATPAAGNTILFYRIYRDPGSTGNPSYTDRYDTNGGTGLTYQDRNPGATTNHTYVVTAVDNTYEESAPLNAVTTP